jgi:Rod binding domain-containing protein
MNLSLPNEVGPLTSAVASRTAPPAGKAEKAACEFESVLLTSLFDSLQKSFSFDAKDDSPGASDYRMMGTQALAEAISRGGGIGIAQLIVSHLQGPISSRKEGTGVPPGGKVLG